MDKAERMERALLGPHTGRYTTIEEPDKARQERMIRRAMKAFGMELRRLGYEAQEAERKYIVSGKRKEMFDAYAAGNTLDAVGKLFGVTRERVRQVISKFPDYKAHSKNKRKPREIRRCWCGADFEVIITSTKRVCSTKAHGIKPEEQTRRWWLKNTVDGRKWNAARAKMSMDKLRINNPEEYKRRNKINNDKQVLRLKERKAQREKEIRIRLARLLERRTAGTEAE